MKKITIIIITMLILINVGAFAKSGNDILKEIKKRTSSKDSYSSISMYIYDDASSDEYRTIQMAGFTRGSDDSYMEFVYPNSIAGMKMLNLDDDIWMYFPSTGRIRKIAEHSKKSSIKGVGGDLNYEDFSGQDYSKKYNGTVQSKDSKQWVVKCTPKKSNAVYSKVILYVNKSNYTSSHAEMYEKGAHTKTMYFYDYKKVAGIWTPMSMVITNSVKGSKTEIVTHEIEYNIGVKSEYFSPSYLEE